ncbi:hypothetical protein H4R35_006762 [Dimargaris xerosporica]|nr:hypothetical protein H4R35_006762 [Dimargaris xerosporica]
MAVDLSFAWSALQAILQVFVISLCGFLFAKCGYIPKPVQKGLSVLNMNFFTPCLLFSSMVETITPEIIVKLWPLMFFYFAFSGLAIVLSIVGTRILRISPDLHRFVIVALMFSNTNSLPISLLKGIMQSSGASILFNGPDDSPLKASGRAVSYAVIFVMLNNLLRWTVGVRLFGPHAEAKHTIHIKPAKFHAHNHLVLTPSDVSIAIDAESLSATGPSSPGYGTAGSTMSSPRSGILFVPELPDEPFALPTPQHSLSEERPLLGSGTAMSRQTSSPRGHPATWMATVASYLHPMGCILKSVGQKIYGCLNAPIYAILAAFIVQFVPLVNSVVMDPDSIFKPIVNAIDISGDASIPVMLLSLGSQLANVKLRSSQPMSRNSSTATIVHHDQQAPEDTAGLLHPSSAAIHGTTDETSSISPSSATTSGPSQSTRTIALVMLSRFVIFPAIVVPVLLLLRPYIPLAASDPVFLITLFVLCCMPPAINLITVAQSMGVFEDESARLLFFTYTSAIPILTILITIFLTVLSHV